MSEWILTEKAALIISVRPDTMYKIREVRQQHGGAMGRHGGVRWLREDCEELVRIRRECRLPTSSAAKVLQAKTEGRL